MIGRHISLDVIKKGEIPDMPIQFFLKSPLTLNFTPHSLSPSLFDGHKGDIFTHATYVGHLGKKMNSALINSLSANLEDDLSFLDRVNGIGTVLHYRRSRERDANEENIRLLLEAGLSEFRSKVIIENTKGTRISDMYELQDTFRKSIGFCFDTCHLFISGYDLRDRQVAFDLFHEIRGTFPDLKLLHFNDAASKTKDVHEEVPFGYIGNPKLGGNRAIFPLIVKEMKKISRDFPLIEEV